MAVDRERKPHHQGFHRKEKAPRAAAPRRPDNVRVPADGPIKVFFDDEREMPEGFVIARTIPDLRSLLQSIDLSRLHTVCLDWHIRADMRTTSEESGHDAVAMLVEMIEADHSRFSSLSSIWLHSTDIEEAVAMARTLRKCIEAPERRDFFEDVYVLPDTYSPNVGI